MIFANASLKLEQGMGEFLEHPLVVLLVGAVLTGVLIPAFTRRWQNRQKELELKTQLVSELSETIMEIMMSVQFIHVAPNLKDKQVDLDRLQREFDQAYRNWEVRSAVLGTKLEAYFPATTIPTEWGEFSEIITDFYALEGTGGEAKLNLASNIRRRLSTLLGPGSVVDDDWGHLKDGVLQGKCQLIQKVLRSRISVL